MNKILFSAPHTRVIIDSYCHLIPSPQVRRSGTYKWCCWGFATCHGTPIMPEAIINRVYRCVQWCTVGWWYSDAKQVSRWWWGVAAGEREVAWTTRLMASLWKLSSISYNNSTLYISVSQSELNWIWKECRVNWKWNSNLIYRPQRQVPGKNMYVDVWQEINKCIQNIKYTR